MFGGNARLHDVYTNRLLKSRNRVMAVRIARHLSPGKAFIAVGTAHLPGETSILKLLASKGYDFNRVY